MKPIEQVSVMATLDLMAGLPNGNMALPLGLQTVALFLQEDIGQHRQVPEAHNRDRAHQLILVQPQLFFAIAKENLNIPARCDMHQQQRGLRLQIAGSPVTCLREAGHPTTDAR